MNRRTWMKSLGIAAGIAAIPTVTQMIQGKSVNLAGLGKLGHGRDSTLGVAHQLTQRIADMAVDFVWANKPNDMEFLPAPPTPEDIILLREIRDSLKK